MSGLREEKKRRTQRSLAHAAVALLIDAGDEGATIAAIAKQAGVSARTFHNYFDAREDAFMFFLIETIDDWVTQVKSAPAQEAPIDVLHRIMVDLYTRPENTLSTPPNLLAIGEQVVAKLGARGKAQHHHLFDELRDALIDQSGGTLTPFRATTLIHVSLAASGVVLEAIHNEELAEGRDIRTLLDDSFGYVAQGLR